jgi:hypothetical protein
MAKRNRPSGPRKLICERTGTEFDWCGYGRPPKYCPAARKEVDRERRAAAYVAKQAAKGKTVRPRLAA